ncbi:MAG: AAA family ATPase, partial [Firmicutes bacterium]|nr:AAA family ATPase [Bacillota bacterium]
MINLKQVRVVNWHYFKDEIIRIGKLTLLSGKNGMGKSTLIDAIQYALAADLRKAKFNQAAGDRRGGRDLAGYVRCKIGSDSTEFLRGDTVAHVLLDFDMGKEHMTAAVCVEAYSDGRTSEHFWLGENFDIKTFEVKSDEGKVLSWRQCKEQLLARSCLFYESKREYLRYVTDRLGVYRRMSEYNPYLEAFTRSVSFTPLVSVDRFVCDYIL